MTTNYPLGDFLIRLKNASLANRNEIITPKTKLIVAVARVLLEAGYLRDVKVDKNDLIVNLAIKSKKPVLANVKLVSKLGLRIYQNSSKLAGHRGSSILLISTPKGIMTSNQAIKQNTGGEVIAEIW